MNLKVINLLIICGSFFILFIAFDCNREPVKKNNDGNDPTDTGVTITLWNKSLPIIQSYIKGHWKLQYTEGGFAAGTVFDKYNSYMILNSDSIILGNDPLGIYVDTSIVWLRSKNMFNDSTFLLSYSDYKYSGYPYPERYTVYEIKNDTLLLVHDVLDGYYYYYSK